MMPRRRSSPVADRLAGADGAAAEATAEMPASPVNAGAVAAPSGEEQEARQPEPLGRRLLQPHTILSFLIAVGILVFFFFRLDINIGAVWRNIRHADLRLYALACALYYGSFGLRAVRWRWMMEEAGIRQDRGYTVPPARRFAEIIMLSWFVNSVVPAKLGDAYRAFLAKRETGASFSASFGTILAERLTDLVVLFATMAGAGAIAFRGHLPQEATRTLTMGLALLAVGFIGVLALWFARNAVQQRLPARFQSQFGHLHDAIFACLRNPWRPLGVSVLIWVADGLRFFLVASAVGAEISVPTAAFVSLMGALLTTLPVTPAGLGVVEVAVISVLKLVGVESSLGGSIAVLDRLLTYWSLVAVGLVLYLRRLRNDVR